MSRLLLIENCGGQAQVVREHIVPQTLDDLPSDPTWIVALHVVANTAQRENHDYAKRNLPENFRALVQKRTVHERLDEVCERCIGTGEQNRAQHTDEEHAQIGLRVFQQAAIDQPGIRRRRHARTRRGAQGFESSCTVAMLSCAKPIFPATSMAVTTAW